MAGRQDVSTSVYTAICYAVCGVMLAKQWLGRLAVGWVVAAMASLLGLWASYRLDLPTGAAIVVVCGLLLALVSIVASLRRAS